MGHRAARREALVDRIRSDPARLGDGLAGEEAAVDEQPVDPPQPQVGRDDVAGPEEDDVTRHEARGGHVEDRPVPPDAAHRGARLAERLERPLAAVLGEDVGTDDRREREQDEDAVADLAERDGQDAGDQEQDDERLGGGLEHEPPDGPGVA